MSSEPRTSLPSDTSAPSINARAWGRRRPGFRQKGFPMSRHIPSLVVLLACLGAVPSGGATPPEVAPAEAAPPAEPDSAELAKTVEKQSRQIEELSRQLDRLEKKQAEDSD